MKTKQKIISLLTAFCLISGQWALPASAFADAVGNETGNVQGEVVEQSVEQPSIADAVGQIDGQSDEREVVVTQPNSAASADTGGGAQSEASTNSESQVEAIESSAEPTGEEKVDIADAWAAGPLTLDEAGEYYLSKDVASGGALCIKASEGETITLDLQGHTVKVVGNLSAAIDASESKGAVRIIDSTYDAEGSGDYDAKVAPRSKIVMVGVRASGPVAAIVTSAEPEDDAVAAASGGVVEVSDVAAQVGISSISAELEKASANTGDSDSLPSIDRYAIYTAGDMSKGGSKTVLSNVALALAPTDTTAKLSNEATEAEKAAAAGDNAEVAGAFVGIYATHGTAVELQRRIGFDEPSAGVSCALFSLAENAFALGEGFEIKSDSPLSVYAAGNSAGARIAQFAEGFEPAADIESSFKLSTESSLAVMQDNVGLYVGASLEAKNVDGPSRVVEIGTQSTDQSSVETSMTTQAVDDESYWTDLGYERIEDKWDSSTSTKYYKLPSGGGKYYFSQDFGTEESPTARYILINDAEGEYVINLNGHSVNIDNVNSGASTNIGGIQITAAKSVRIEGCAPSITSPTDSDRGTINVKGKFNGSAGIRANNATDLSVENVKITVNISGVVTAANNGFAGIWANNAQSKLSVSNTDIVVKKDEAQKVGPLYGIYSAATVNPVSMRNCSIAVNDSAASTANTTGIGVKGGGLSILGESNRIEVNAGQRIAYGVNLVRPAADMRIENATIVTTSKVSMAAYGIYATGNGAGKVLLAGTTKIVASNLNEHAGCDLYASGWNTNGTPFYIDSSFTNSGSTPISVNSNNNLEETCIVKFDDSVSSSYATVFSDPLHSVDVGWSLRQDADGLYVAAPSIVSVTQSGGSEPAVYGSFAKALAAASSGATITLLVDCVDDGMDFNIGDSEGSYTVDLAGHSLKYLNATTPAAVNVIDTGSSKGGITGAVSSSGTGVLSLTGVNLGSSEADTKMSVSVNSGASMKLSGCTLERHASGSADVVLVQVQGGKLEADSTKIIVEAGGNITGINNYTDGNVSLNGVSMNMKPAEGKWCHGISAAGGSKLSLSGATSIFGPSASMPDSAAIFFQNDTSVTPVQIGSDFSADEASLFVLGSRLVDEEDVFAVASDGKTLDATKAKVFVNASRTDLVAQVSPDGNNLLWVDSDNPDPSINIVSSDGSFVRTHFSLQKAAESCEAENHIQLIRDYALDKTLDVARESDLEIDLSGHAITLTEDFKARVERAYEPETPLRHTSNGALTLKSGAADQGVIDFGIEDSLNISNGVLSIENIDVHGGVKAKNLTFSNSKASGSVSAAKLNMIGSTVEASDSSDPVAHEASENNPLVIAVDPTDAERSALNGMLAKALAGEAGADAAAYTTSTTGTAGSYRARTNVDGRDVYAIASSSNAIEFDSFYVLTSSSSNAPKVVGVTAGAGSTIADSKIDVSCPNGSAIGIDATDASLAGVTVTAIGSLTLDSDAPYRENRFSAWYKSWTGAEAAVDGSTGSLTAFVIGDGDIASYALVTSGDSSMLSGETSLKATGKVSADIYAGDNVFLTGDGFASSEPMSVESSHGASASDPFATVSPEAIPDAAVAGCFYKAGDPDTGGKISGSKIYWGLYSGSFVDETGTTVQSYENLKYGAEITAPAARTMANTPECTYAFVGWKASSGVIVSEADVAVDAAAGAKLGVAGDLTYYPVFKRTYVDYKVTFKGESGNAIGETATYRYGTDVTVPEAPAVEGKVFIGWQSSASSGTYYTAANMPQAGNDNASTDVTYTAKYRAASAEGKYAITWNVDGEAVTRSYDVGTAPVYDGETPSKQGDAQYFYEFAGWSDGNETYSDLSAKTDWSDCVLTAVFDKQVRSYEVTFTVGSTDTKMQVEYGAAPAADEVSAIDTAKASTRSEDFTFAGWAATQSGAPVVMPGGEFPTVTGEHVNTQWYAVYTSSPRVYTVTFVDSDGMTVYERQADYGTTVSWPASQALPEHSKATQYHIFDMAGWSKTEGATSADYDTGDAITISGDTVLYPVYSEKYRITFHGAGANGADVYGDFAVGAKPTCPTTPAKSPDSSYSYRFVGWAATGGLYGAESVAWTAANLPVVAGAADYYPVYVKYATLIFKDYSAIPTTRTVVSGGSVSAPIAASKPGGYVFSNWNTKSDGTGTAVSAGGAIQVDGNATYYAVYEPLKAKTLTDSEADLTDVTINGNYASAATSIDLEVERTAAGDAYNLGKQAAENEGLDTIAAWDARLVMTTSYGEETLHSGFGTLRLSFYVGDEYDGKDITIYHVHYDGRVTALKRTCENGSVSIATTDLSTFVTAYENEDSSKTDDGNKNNSSNGTTGSSGGTVNRTTSTGSTGTLSSTGKSLSSSGTTASLGGSTSATVSGSQAQIGATLETLTPERAQQIWGAGADVSGVYVNGVSSDGPAAKAGLVEGDVIVSVDGTPVTSLEELNNALAGKSAGDTVRLQVNRDGEVWDADVVLGSADEATIKIENKSASDVLGKNGSDGRDGSDGVKSTESGSSAAGGGFFDWGNPWLWLIVVLILAALGLLWWFLARRRGGDDGEDDDDFDFDQQSGSTGGIAVS